MASLLPTPVAAVLGLVPTVLSGVRALPGRAVQLPVLAIGSALSTADTLRREYDDLAERGEQLVQRLRGGAVEVATDVTERADLLEDRVEELVAKTPLGGAYDRVEDGAEDALSALRGGKPGEAGLTLVQTGGDVAAEVGQALQEQLTSADAAPAAETADAVPEAEQPKGAPTPKAVEPDTTRVDTAASPSVVAAVEQAAAAAPAGVPHHDDLPLPDYDHMTLGSLRGRMRSLSVDQLVAIRAYEKAHADRLPIVTMLDNRIAKLATDASAAPSGPVSTEPAPEQRAVAAAGGTGSRVSPATTNAPKINPPSQGVPTNPAQPR